MHEYYAQENGKIYYAITSRDARENDATQTRTVLTRRVSSYGLPAWVSSELGPMGGRAASNISLCLAFLESQKSIEFGHMSSRL